METSCYREIPSFRRNNETANQEFVRGQTLSNHSPLSTDVFTTSCRCRLSVSLSQFKNLIKYLLSAGTCSKLFTFITQRLHSSQSPVRPIGLSSPFPSEETGRELSDAHSAVGELGLGGRRPTEGPLDHCPLCLCRNLCGGRGVPVPYVHREEEEKDRNTL